jgi:hypothetical protein
LLFGWLALAAFCCDAHARSKPEVIFESACSCRGNHGVARWKAKTDLSEPPASLSDIKAVTPSQIYAWQGPGGNMPRGAGRSATENEWYAITGQLAKLRVEDDGDLHLVLVNAKDNNPGEVVIEIPLGDRWCELRKLVFSWTDASFPFSTGRSPFRLLKHPIITAFGKAFYDTDHSDAHTRSNKRPQDQKTAVWEIHPVMRLAIASSIPFSTPSLTQPSSPPVLGSNVVQSPSRTATASVTSSTDQFVTITRPVTIVIPYGETTLPVGMKLKIVLRSPNSVTVRYLNGNYSVPIGSTDLK